MPAPCRCLQTSERQLRRLLRCRSRAKDAFKAAALGACPIRRCSGRSAVPGVLAGTSQTNSCASARGGALPSERHGDCAKARQAGPSTTFTSAYEDTKCELDASWTRHPDGYPSRSPVSPWRWTRGGQLYCGPRYWGRWIGPNIEVRNKVDPLDI